jgi:hypothetical protein
MVDQTSEEITVTAEKSDEPNIIDKYPDGSTKIQSRNVVIGEVAWDIVEEFSSAGVRRKLIQVSSNQNIGAVREITYDEKGVATEIFLPHNSDLDVSARITLKADGSPSKIDCVSKITKEARTYSFINDTTVKLETPGTNKPKQASAKTASAGLAGSPATNFTLTSATKTSPAADPLSALLSPGSAPILSAFDLRAASSGLSFASGADGETISLKDRKGNGTFVKGLLARGYMPLSPVDIGISHSPSLFKVLSLWPSGIIRIAEGSSSDELPMQFYYTSESQIVATKGIEKKDGATSLLTRGLSFDTNFKSTLRDCIVQSEQGHMRGFSTCYPNGSIHYVINFHTSKTEPKVPLISLVELDAEERSIHKWENIPYSENIFNRSHTEGFTEEQQAVIPLVRFLLCERFAPLYNYFEAPENHHQRLEIADKPHPLSIVQGSWKAPQDAILEKYTTTFDGVPAQAMFWKDKEGKPLHLSQLKPDGKAYRDIWYQDGKPAQIDYNGSSPTRMLTVMLGENPSTQSLITWKEKSGNNPNELYRFDLNPDLMRVERYEGKVITQTADFPSYLALKTLPPLTQSVYAQSMAQVHGVDIGLSRQVDMEALDIHPNGTLKTARFNETDGSAEVFNFDATDGRMLSEIVIKPNSSDFTLFDKSGAAISKLTHSRGQNTRIFKWFRTGVHQDAKNPPLDIKIDINDKKKTFVVRQYNADGKSVADTKEIPLEHLGKAISAEYIVGGKGITIPEALAESLTHSQTDLDTFEQFEKNRLELVAKGITPEIVMPEEHGIAIASEVKEVKREDGSVQWKNQKNADGSGELTYYWKGKKRSSIHYSNTPYEKWNSHIDLVDAGKLPEAKNRHHVVPEALELFKDMKDHHNQDIIIDFSHVDRIDESHIEAIKALQKEVEQEITAQAWKDAIENVRKKRMSPARNIGSKLKQTDAADEILPAVDNLEDIIKDVATKATREARIKEFHGMGQGIQDLEKTGQKTLVRMLRSLSRNLDNATALDAAVQDVVAYAETHEIDITSLHLATLLAPPIPPQTPENVIAKLRECAQNETADMMEAALKELPKRKIWFAGIEGKDELPKGGKPVSKKDTRSGKFREALKEALGKDVGQKILPAHMNIRDPDAPHATLCIQRREDFDENERLAYSEDYKDGRMEQCREHDPKTGAIKHNPQLEPKPICTDSLFITEPSKRKAR